MIKKNIFIAVMITLLVLVFTTKLTAFDWPQPPENIGVLFSQIRGDNFSKGIVFINPGEVAVAEEGVVIMSLENDISNMGWFESPLGNTIIIAHQNDMLSVYANLINLKIDPNNRNIQTGEIIATSGESGWKRNNEGLDFQIIDTKMQTIINPVIFMDSTPQVKRYTITKITAVNRNGEKIVMGNGIALNAGSYTLYMNRSPDTMILNSTVSLNGSIKETVKYDALKQSDSLLTINGNETYPFSIIYPDDNSIRLAEIILSRGTNTIEISITDIVGRQSSIRYRVTVI